MPDLEPESQPALGRSNSNKRIRETTIDNLLGTPSPSPVSKKKRTDNINNSSQKAPTKPSSPSPRKGKPLDKRVNELTDEVMRLKALLRVKSSQIEKLSNINAKFWRAKRHFEGLSKCFETDDI